MRRPRLGPTLAALALTLLAAGLAVSVPQASAIDPFPNTGIATLSGNHFQIHWNRDNLSTDCPTMYITQETAGDVLGWADRAYDLYTSWGYSAPILDGDGDLLLEIAVDEFDKPAPVCISYGVIDPSIPTNNDGTLERWDALINPVAPAGAGEIHLNAARGINFHIVAHEVFHLFTRAMNASADQWLHEGTAEWAAVRADAAVGGTEQNPDRTSDCVGSECGDTEYDRNGYPGWMLFEYLAERYGDSTVKAVWDQAAADPAATGTADLEAALPSGTLETFFNDYTTARLTGNFASPLLAGTLPAAYGTLPVGESSGTVSLSNIAVNHLAVRYIALQHGTSDGPCYTASLAITVTIPGGVVSTPTYFANTKGAVAQPLSVSGSTASLTVPWNTCAGSPDAYLSLPNDTHDSSALDGREFVLRTTVTVDRTKPASPSEPPAPRSVIGPVISAPTSDPAPSLKVYAPEVIRVSAKTRLLRFAVFSSGGGTLQATLGSAGLGSAALRGGNNDIRFVLPKQLFAKLRAKSASNVLALTSMSPSGSRGATVTRRVVLQAAKKPKRRR